jgi:transposase InsO family protein
MGIRVIFNRVRTPQDNAKVERSQGVLSDWTEWEKCDNMWQLQCALWDEVDFHNIHFPVSRLQNRTRIQAFPNMLKSPKDFNPADFDIQRAFDFLATGSWEREVSLNGQFSFWGKRYQAGTKLAHQVVSLKMNAKNRKWQVFGPDGILLKELDTHFTADNIWKLGIN